MQSVYMTIKAAYKIDSSRSIAENSKYMHKQRQAEVQRLMSNEQVHV